MDKKPLGFADFITVKYRPGEDDLTNYRAVRRKRLGDSTSEAYDPTTGKHEKGVTPGYGFKHKTIKDPANPKRHTHVHQLSGESKDVDEALTVTQRLQRKKQMKRIAPKLKMGRARAARRIASKEKLERRAIKKARTMILKKLTKDIPKSELSYARRQEIEKRLEKPQIKQRIKMIAKRLFPKERKAEVEKKTRSKQK